MTMPLLQNRDYTLSVAGTMGRNSVVAMLGNYMVIGRLKNNTITFRITDFTEEDTIVLICPEGGSITHAKLERGNKASDWTPAPEDAQARIDNTVNSLKNEVIPAIKDGLLNSSEKEAVKQSLNVVSADKKGIDTQYTTVYANTALTGNAKTNLNSAKVALNTAFTNLQNAINDVLGVEEGTRITNAQMTLVTTRLNEYGTALSTYNQRYEQAQDAISTEKKRLGDVYAEAQANLAKTQANAYADGKITAAEERAIDDAQAKLAEAKKYVDDLEVGGTNLIVQSRITKDKYLTATGAETASTGWFFTDYINVKDYKNLIASGYSNLGTAPSVVYYNSAKVMTRAIANGSKSLGANITVQPGEEFIRFSGMLVDLPTIKLEKGKIATDWSPAPEDVQADIGSKANAKETEKALNDATAILQTLQQEVEAAALDNSLKDFIEKYNKEQEALDADKIESNKKLQEALGSISLLTNNMGNMSETWNFVDRFIKNSPEGILVGNDEKGSYILIKEDRLSFYSNNEEVAFIAQNLMQISRGAFVEQIQISQYIFEKYGTNQLAIRYAG